MEHFPRYDIASGFAYSTNEDFASTIATIYQIALAQPGESSEYVIRTGFMRPGNLKRQRRKFLPRVYAMRENGHWVLSNALSRTTRDWKRTEFDRITYVQPSEHVIDTVRARNAVHFVDSLTPAFDAPIRRISPTISRAIRRSQYEFGLDWLGLLKVYCCTCGLKTSPPHNDFDFPNRILVSRKFPTLWERAARLNASIITSAEIAPTRTIWEH